MSQTSINPEKIVKDYIKQVKKKMPEWFKDKKTELQDVLDEIENHVWDKSYELAESENPSAQDVEAAIQYIGSPAKITKDYKKRGTPAFYITEELLPLYKKTSTIIIAIVIGLRLVGMLVEFATNSPVDPDLGIFSIIISVLFFTTIGFVILSREGYLPENLGIKAKKRKKETSSEIEYEKFESGISHKKAIPPKYVKKGGLMIGGLIVFFFGTMFISQPQLPQSENLIIPIISSEFRMWIRFVGIVMILEGFLLIYRATLSKINYTGHIIVMILIALTVIPSLGLLIWLDGNTQILPTLADISSELANLDITIGLDFFETASNYQTIIRIIMIGQLIEFGERLYRIIRLIMDQSK
jgi:hypothetical protein